jgi:probable HAF family extracellular repeat protein
MVDLGTLDSRFETLAYDVSPSGQVVGSAYAPIESGITDAFSWTKQTGMLDLGTLPGSYGSFPVGVIASGQVIGHSDQFNNNTGNVDTRMFSWTEKGGMVELATFGGNETTPYAISATGQVVGSANSATNPEIHAFSWTALTGMVDLGTLGGFRSDALAVNARGQIVGTSTTSVTPDPDGVVRSPTHAVLWQPSWATGRDRP